jgi:hypothetical protein
MGGLPAILNLAVGGPNPFCAFIGVGVHSHGAPCLLEGLP